MRYSEAELATFARAYAEEGAAHVPGLMTPEWRAALLAAVDKVVAHADDPRAIGPTVECGIAPRRKSLRWMWRDVPEVRAFFAESDVAPVVARAIGAARVQYWYDLTFVHEPGAGGAGTPWHHDIGAFPFKGEQIPSLWIALVDIEPDMSPLMTITGSHRCGTMYRPPARDLNDVPLPEGYSEQPDFEAMLAAGDVEARTWLVKAGDAIVIHPYTIHGARPNRSADRTRIGFSSRWIGDDVRWRPDAFSMPIPGVDYADAPVGERPSGPFFPYADAA